MFGILRRIRVVPSLLVTGLEWRQHTTFASKRTPPCPPPTISVTTSCVTGTLLNQSPIRDRSVSGFPLG